MTVYTIPPGKLKCFVTGVLRPDTPEENVRQRTARSLVDEYGYMKEDLGIEVVIKMGRAKKRADIVIYERGQSHITENIIGIVEAKPENIKPTHPEAGIDQLKGYLSATPNSKFGLWAGSEVLAFQKIVSEGKITFEDYGDIPLASGEDSSPVTFDSLVPASDALKDVFRRCHNYVAANQGGSKEAAFHEFLKITFCKVFDERHSETPRFYIRNETWKSKKSQEELYERLSQIFTEVCEEYGYIFGGDDTIKLRKSVCAYIVKELQKYTLLDTDFDYKGSAYEEIVGANSRGDRGEFFTPRNLCALAVGILRQIVGDERFLRLRVIDPACGTGGFLRSFVHELYSIILEREQKKWSITKSAKDKAKSRLKEICDRNVYGIDFNPVLVRAAQMNLVMHGDGSSNVFHENSLLSYGEWGTETRTKVKDKAFDAVITNPPFGDDLSVDDPHVLSQYSIHRFGKSGVPTQSPPQVLFLERCWRLLKPNRFLLVVTPDNILSNPSYKSVRGWILTHFNILASISLPGEMFQPHTGTQTSLLVLKKYVEPFSDIDSVIKHAATQNVFISIPSKIGHDQRGNLLAARDELGNVILREVAHTRIVKKPSGQLAEEKTLRNEIVADDQLPQVLSDFTKWMKEAGLAHE